MRHVRIFLSTFALVLAVAGTAHAADGHTNWPDLGWRVITAAAVVFIIYKAAGKMIAGALSGRRQGIAQELDDLEARKEKARKDLLDVEKRIASLEKERKAILKEYEARGEALKTEIVAKAEATAAQIMTQAKQTAQNEIDGALAAMREDLAEKIVAAASESIAGSLTAKDQEKLLDSVLNKVVLQ